MRTHSPKARSSRLKLALALFIGAILGWFVNLAIYATSPSQGRSWDSVASFAAEFAGFVAHIAMFLGVLTILRLKILPIRAQRIAMWLVLFATAGMALAFMFTAGLKFCSWVGLGSASFGSLVSMSWSGKFYWSVFVINLGSELPWIVLLFRPSLSLSVWSGPRERAFRSFLLVILLLSITSYVWWIELLLGVTPRLSLVFESSVLTIPIHTWIAIIELLTISGLAVFLFHLYRHAHELLPPDPNHCTACAYPLDPNMTTCPECGTIRATRSFGHGSSVGVS